MPAGPPRVTAANAGGGVPGKEFGRGAARPSSAATLHPQAPNGSLSRLPLNSVGAGGGEAGKEACAELPEPSRGPQVGTAAASPRESLRFRGKDVRRNTHPNASSVSRTSPSIVGSGPGSGPLMVLRAKAVRRSKEPAGNRRCRAKVPVGILTRIACSASDWEPKGSWPGGSLNSDGFI